MPGSVPPQMMEALREEVAALERELAAKEALQDAGGGALASVAQDLAATSATDVAAALAIDEPAAERVTEDDAERVTEDDDDGEEENDDDSEEDDDHDHDGSDDVLTKMPGMAMSELFAGGNEKAKSMPETGGGEDGGPPKMSLKNSSLHPTKSFRKDAPYSFESRDVLNKAFRRLRDLKSPLDMDLHGAVDPRDSQEELPISRAGSAGAATPKKMSEIKQDSLMALHSDFSGSFPRVMGGATRAAARGRDRLPSNSGSVPDRKDFPDIMEDGLSTCGEMSQEDDEAKLSAATARRRRSSVISLMMKAKTLRKRRPSGSVVSGVSLRSAKDEEEEDEAEDFKSTFSFRVYLKSGGVLGLWVTDVILFIILEIIWIDSVCTSDGYSDSVETAPTSVAGADEVLGEVGLAGKL